MQLYSETGDFKLYHGSMLDMLQVIAPNSIDAVITDPPYEINFMGKGWDNSGIAFQADTWRKCFSVLKSGGYLLAFGGSRTFHRIACAIEDAGFEIRDTIMWLYGSGFPKSLNIGLAIDKRNGIESKVVASNKSGVSSRAFQSEDFTTAGQYEIRQAQNEWDGWGTALKPAYEPIIVARKPCEGSCVDNVLQYGVGGLNIDGCRVGNETLINKGMCSLGVMHDDNWQSDKEVISEVQGRFPSNVILTYDETDKDEVTGGMPYTSSNASDANPEGSTETSIGFSSVCHKSGVHFGDEGSAARYYYCAKASKRDRDEG